MTDRSEEMAARLYGETTPARSQNAAPPPKPKTNAKTDLGRSIGLVYDDEPAPTQRSTGTGVFLGDVEVRHRDPDIHALTSLTLEEQDALSDAEFDELAQREARNLQVEREIVETIVAEERQASWYGETTPEEQVPDFDEEDGEPTRNWSYPNSAHG